MVIPRLVAREDNTIVGFWNVNRDCKDNKDIYIKGKGIYITSCFGSK
jgi:hypothetical protein